VRESISLVAQCIRHASLFEDRNSSSSVATTKGGGEMSFWSNRSDGGRRRTRGGGGVRPILGRGDAGLVVDVDDVDGDGRSDFDLPSFLLRPRRGGKGGAAAAGADSGGRPTHHRPSLATSPADEDVVLKLLSLSVQVLRCPAGRDLLPPGDVIGIFDTCLHVSVAAREEGRSLLRSAAADALGHCVIVVFGMRGGGGRAILPSRGGVVSSCGRDDGADAAVGMLRDDVDTVDRVDGGETDSDDDWGDRDPTEDVRGDAFLPPARKNIATSDPGPHYQYSDVFGAASATTDLGGDEDQIECTKPQEEEPALVAIMHRLASLADPLLHDDDTCQLGLGLVNIALETMSDVDDLSVGYPRLLNVMQNNLCRNLLRLSTSNDLICLGLTLRVIFNLVRLVSLPTLFVLARVLIFVAVIYALVAAALAIVVIVDLVVSFVNRRCRFFRAWPWLPVQWH
jgi:hypothetical protein